jgi:hypothetical protein
VSGPSSGLLVAIARSWDECLGVLFPCFAVARPVLCWFSEAVGLRVGVCLSGVLRLPAVWVALLRLCGPWCAPPACGLGCVAAAVWSLVDAVTAFQVDVASCLLADVPSPADSSPAAQITARRKGAPPPVAAPSFEFSGWSRFSRYNPYSAAARTHIFGCPCKYNIFQTMNREQRVPYSQAAHSSAGTEPFLARLNTCES